MKQLVNGRTGAARLLTDRASILAPAFGGLRPRHPSHGLCIPPHSVYNLRATCLAAARKVVSHHSISSLRCTFAFITHHFRPSPSSFCAVIHEMKPRIEEAAFIVVLLWQDGAHICSVYWFCCLDSHCAKPGSKISVVRNRNPPWVDSDDSRHSQTVFRISSIVWIPGTEWRIGWIRDQLSIYRSLIRTPSVGALIDLLQWR